MPRCDAYLDKFIALRKCALFTLPSPTETYEIACFAGWSILIGFKRLTNESPNAHPTAAGACDARVDVTI